MALRSLVVGHPYSLIHCNFVEQVQILDFVREVVVTFFVLYQAFATTECF